jgi:2-polyprenyl-3-methyl-5-hydroxy-6-metoxy-1,4-benzoquinol methylase
MWLSLDCRTTRRDRQTLSRQLRRLAPGTGGAVQEIKQRTRIFCRSMVGHGYFAGRDWWEPGARKSSREMGVSRSARILDLGCGNGSLIASLADIGFPTVLGADPFIPQDIIHSNGARSKMRGGRDRRTVRRCDDAPQP